MNINNTFVLFTYIAFISLPGLFMNLGVTNSSSLGVIISSVMSLAFLMIPSLNQYVKINNNQLIAFIVVMIGVLFHGILSSYIVESNFDLVKFSFSMLLFCLVFFISAIVANSLTVINDQWFDKLLGRIFWFLVVLGFISAILYNLGLLNRKSVIIFFEPSHYTLALSPFLIYYFNRIEKKRSLLTCFSLILLLILILKSLVLGVALLLVLFIKLKFNIVRVIVFPLLIIAVFSFILSSSSEFSEYFLKRLQLSGQSDNLSVLVFLSGWERAYLSFLESLAFGYGFQQMGISGPTGAIQAKLAILDSGSLNIDDGSFLFSKLIFEFGMFGLLFAFFYLSNFFTVLKLLDVTRNPKIQFSCAVFLSFVIYLFIRGGGYFMPIVFMFMVAILIIFNREYTN